MARTRSVTAAVRLASKHPSGTHGPAIAAGQSVSGAHAAAPDATVACDRPEKRDERRQAVLARLQGDGNTKGSIAWLTAKAAASTASGDTARATLYTDRAALRSAMVDPLKTVQGDLAALIKANCG